MISENQIPRYLKSQLEKFEDHIRHYKSLDEGDITIVKATNARWQVTLFMKIGDKIIIDTWRKPFNLLTKNQRLLILSELKKIGLCNQLTQKTLGEMLGTSTSTIQASLTQLNSEVEQGLPFAVTSKPSAKTAAALVEADNIGLNGC